jgi:hypothetical protein
VTDDVDQQQVKLSIDQFYALRAQAMSGRVSRALESGLSPTLPATGRSWPTRPRCGRWKAAWARASASARIRSTAKAPSIPASTLTRLWDAGARRRRRQVTGASMGAGYGREIVLDHGHDVLTFTGISR